MLDSLYFHVPFCTHRCAYCDFNTYAGQEALIPAYVDALCREIEIVGARTAQPPNYPTIETIFFGGGTPSLLTPKHYEQIFRALYGHFGLSGLSGVETSLEANPGTVSLDYLRDVRALGFNRISFGVQSFHPDELRQLERIHDPFDVFDAVTWARRAGFDNLNLDLIYGLPEQSLDRWSATVKWAASLAPEHLSLYALTIERGTPFGRWARRGLLPLPDPDLAAEMYERAGELLEARGYVQYEISNWAKSVASHQSSVVSPSFACRHNLQTWRNRPYLGFGAGAHGYYNDMRVANVLRIKSYIERLTQDTARNAPCSERPTNDDSSITPLSPAMANCHRLSPREQMQETMMLGLRLTREGVSAKDFASRFGVQVTDVFSKEITELLDLGLLEWVEESTLPQAQKPSGDSHLRLTPRARLIGNQIFMRFVGE